MEKLRARLMEIFEREFPGAELRTTARLPPAVTRLDLVTVDAIDDLVQRGERRVGVHASTLPRIEESWSCNEREARSWRNTPFVDQEEIVRVARTQRHSCAATGNHTSKFTTFGRSLMVEPIIR